MLKKTFLVFFILSGSLLAFGQKKVGDQIVGVVGNKIILQSDVDIQYNNDPSYTDIPEQKAKCNIIYTLLAQRLLVEQARRDSVIVPKEQVEKRINRRVQQFIGQYGSREALEQASGQSIYQLKKMYQTYFKDQMTAQKMQQQLMDKINVTPSEVKTFFNDIPKDSLPMLPATIEMGQIVIKPKIDPIVKNLAKKKLKGIRQKIVAGGKSFATMASIYSMDPSSRRGGKITINKKDFDPQFVAAAYRLQPGEVSPIIKTQFGYHIIKMVKRKGDEAVVRHILIVPEVTSVGIKRTKKKLDSIRADLIAGKITFPKAVAKYSTAEQAKMTAGMILDPQTKSADIALNNLTDPQEVKAATNMKVGEFSHPQVFINKRTRTKECRILYLKSRTTPHRLNLEDDYGLIQDQALKKKRNTFLFNWVRQKSKDYYIHVIPKYTKCHELEGWTINNDTRVGQAK